MKPLPDRALLFITAAALGVCGSAGAQVYPDKPIRIVVPYPPGGTTDFVARLLQNTLSGFLGQSLIIDNRGGATGAIGAEYVARSKPDGYTIVYTPGTDMVLRQYIMKSNPVDVIKDFTPIIAAVQTSSVIAAHNSVPFASAKEFVDYARRNPGKLTYATPGVGSNFHLAGELLKIHGVVLQHVPYKGGGPSLSAVLAGETSLALNDFTTMLPAIRDGRVKGIALIDSKRNPGLPDVPAMNEILPGYEMPESWFAFFGPAGLPGPIVARLNSDISKAVNSPEVRPKLDERNITIITGTPENVTALSRNAIDIYGKVVKAAGLQPE
jgi:tripartite-type tricarboxylate transporter receptor subunit TctC